jgi:hypothetical protein
MGSSLRQPPTFFCLLKRDGSPAPAPPTTNANAYHVLLTNLPFTAEPLAQAFADKQLHKNPPPSSANRKQIGNIGFFPQHINATAASDAQTLCYFYFVASEDFSAWDYIILLMVEFDREEHFDLFRGELDGFSRKVVGLLTDNLTQEKKERISTYLGKWYTLSVEYITRCMNNYGEKLDCILHAAVQGKPIDPTLFPNKHGLSQDTDLLRFMDALNIVSILRSSEKPAPDLLDFTESTSSAATNDFCKAWANTLRDVPRNPLTIRFLLEEKKRAIIQELNSIKRIVNDAKMDNYSLYKAHRALQKSGNHDVLLALLHSDETNAVEDQDFKDILQVLSEYSTSSLPTLTGASASRSQTPPPASLSSPSPIETLAG